MQRLVLVLLLVAAASMGCKRKPKGEALAVPGLASGMLTESDTRLQDGSVADDFVLNLTAGQPVTIVVRGGPSVTTPGTNLDVYAILLQNNAELTHDDDSAGNLNSRIIFVPPSTGTYVLRVTTYGGGLKQGQYTVQTFPGANPGAA